jgi:hypothetical protein
VPEPTVNTLLNPFIHPHFQPHDQPPNMDMDIDHHSPPPTNLEPQSQVESLPSDTNTEESFEIDDWSSLSPTIETREQYSDYQFHYQQQQQQQFYPQQQQQPVYHPQQFGYMTPQYSSTPPYSGYYMPSPPVDYQNTNSYGHYYEPQQQQQQQVQRIVMGTPSPNADGYNCDICVRTFKSAANLTRHLMSKTHQKRLHSRKPANRAKKQKLGSVLTDLSDEEKRFLWTLDDEISMFLQELEGEKVRVGVGRKGEILPTPPLSPSQRRREEQRLREIEDEQIFAEIIEEVDEDGLGVEYMVAGDS